MGSGGQIRQRKSGLWEGRYVGADHRRHSVYGKTKREAQEKLRAALTAADHGIRPATGRVTVGAWLDEWMMTSVEPRNRPRTIGSYRETVNRYIDPAIGRIPLTRLQPEDVAGMLRRLSDRGLSPTTVRYAHAVLRIALGRAVKSGRVIRNVASLVEPPARKTAERRPLTAGQARAFLALVAEDRLAALYSLAIATGMRQGELLALRWEDVDLDGGRLTIRHTLRLGTRDLAEPKTERARRTLRLGADSLVALREHRRRQLEERLAAGRRWVDGDFVFTTSIGTPLDSRNVTKAFQRVLAQAGLPHQRFHDLRHACATLLLEDGEDLGVVSRILGHSQIATTADVYAHLTPAMLERSAARMDAILARRPEAASG
jgi:integrase